jgi:hypothetical protein
VKASSGATAVQIVYPSHRGSRDIEYLGSAHDGAQVELLKAAARQRLAAGPGELDLGLDTGARGGPLPITSSRTRHRWDALARAYCVLEFDKAAGGDAVFAQLVLARIIEPTSKLDSAPVLEEAGISAPSYRALLRPLPAYAKQAWRQRLAAACARHARPHAPSTRRGALGRRLPAMTCGSSWSSDWAIRVRCWCVMRPVT